jgi:hypothetical protein
VSCCAGMPVSARTRNTNQIIAFLNLEKKAALTEHIRTAPGALGGFLQELLNHRQESIRLDKERSYCDRDMHLEPAALDREFNSRAVLGRTCIDGASELEPLI